MKPSDLIVRCLLLKKEGQWVALCLDFTLAAQAETADQAKRLLVAQIDGYVNDALSGLDIKHAPALLRRRAPAKYWLMYYAASVIHHIGRLRLNAFEQPLPLRSSHA